MSAADLDTLIATYNRHDREKRPEDFWAWEAVGEIMRGTDGERAWELLVALVRSTAFERLEYVGAGPVENFVETHGVACIDRIVGEARSDPHFREALATVWLVSDEFTPTVLARLQAATGYRILVATQAELDRVSVDAIDELPRFREV